MQKTLAFLLAVLLGACVVDPQPDDSAEDCGRICGRRAECPGHSGETECMDACVAAHYPAGCADAFDAASCTEISGSSSSPSFLNACYPACAPDGQVCQGDTVAACNTGHLVQQDCDYRCKAQGGNYAGVCAATRNGQPTPNGLPDCWCD